MKPFFSSLFACFLLLQTLFAQNSLVGDGFGGRSWYKPYNYTVGSYSGYTVCGANRQLYAWGHNGYGQLGRADVISSVKPLRVPLMDQVAYYSTGYLMAAIKKDRSGWIWGKEFSIPTRVIADVTFVDAGIQSCVFVRQDGTVWSVGRNFYGGFGNGQSGTQLQVIPVQMQQVQQAVRTAVSNFATAVLLQNGEVLVCGTNIFGVLGNGQTTADTMRIPVKVPGLKDIVDIKATTYGFCALDKNGDIWQWGRTSNINSPNGFAASPFRVSGLSQIVAITGCADGYHFMALDEQQRAFAWGDNSFGQCGVPTAAIWIDSPTLVTTGVVDIMAGEWFSYIVKTDGSLWCAGYDGYIWLDLPRQRRDTFTRLNPQAAGIDLCDPLKADETDDWTEAIDSSLLPLPHVLWFPSAFTPNGDAVNGIFRAIPKPGTVLQDFRLSLFNRWGQRVYVTYDLQTGWNGMHGGLPASADTYFFHCEYRQAGKAWQYLKGDVTLIR